MSVILTDEFLAKYKNKQPEWGYNGLGYIVYKRTYARPKEDGTIEEWNETVARCINGAQDIGADYTQAEAEELYDLVFNLKCNFAGRMLWQLGTDTVLKHGGNSLLNCWFTALRRPQDFSFIFENLMLGGGVGFSVKGEDIHELPRIKKKVKVVHEKVKDADFIVPDSRQGWIKLLEQVLDAYFVSGKSFTYSTILIRGAGEPIKGFGGVASGPQPLVDGMTSITEIMSARAGKKLRPIDVLDICNIIGSIVVAGNVRRSAEIALGDPDNFHFLRAKRWDLGNIPNWRSMSNNTIFADDYSHISDSVWEGYMGTGEPYGLFNLPLSQKFGRLGDKIKDNCEGLNPCGEITLADYECCNLAELYLNNIESPEQLTRCALLLYKTQKAIAALEFLHEETNKIVHKNMRLGLGVTGICQSFDKIDWLDKCYTELKEYDKIWSAKKGYNESIKLTTVKPSGTNSLLCGATPGVHAGFSRHYIRRIRVSAGDKLVDMCREMGYNIENVRRFDTSIDHKTFVVEFPCEAGDKAILAEDMTAIKQLELVKRIQTVWSDNAVSVTVYYKKEEMNEIKEWLEENYKTSIKSVSFVLHNEHGFDQPPYEEIDKETYDKMLSKVTPIVHLTDLNGEESQIEGIECEGGACPIK